MPTATSTRCERSSNDRPVKSGLPRWVEVPVALAGLIAVAPILAVASLAIKFNSPGSAIFRQKRVGRGGREFVMYKLRTMQWLNKGPELTASGDHRVTTIGKLLRKTKLDEIPELWNVVRGDMSLFGPRPEVPAYVDLRNPFWQIIVQARPGITDPVTLQLRNEEQLLGAVDGDRERFYRDELQPYKLIGYVEYLRSRSWKSDVKLLKDTAVGIAWPKTCPIPTLDQIRESVRHYSIKNSNGTASTE